MFLDQGRLYVGPCPRHDAIFYYVAWNLSETTMSKHSNISMAVLSSGYHYRTVCVLSSRIVMENEI